MAQINSEKTATKPKKPDWLRIRPPSGDTYIKVRSTMKRLGLHTVCEEALCPNTGECWGSGTATILILGGVCTRNCRFCAAKKGKRGEPLDPGEPERIAEAVRELDISYLVLTSVDRDDLSDGGAGHFSDCIKNVKSNFPDVIVEALIPDFQGNMGSLMTVIGSGPDVVSHNIETTENLQHMVRDRRANYRQSLTVLENVKKIEPRIFTKSSLMLGLGETEEDVLKTLNDLQSAGVDIVTIGQYLQPTKNHLPVSEYVALEKFEYYKKRAEDMGFKSVASAPLVRSSYKASVFERCLIPKKGL